MGVIYKVAPGIKDFVLQKKRENPSLSCRKFVAIIEEEFKAKVSKSSINALLKEAGLSMPVGRRGSGKKPQLKPKISLLPEHEIKLLSEQIKAVEEKAAPEIPLAQPVAEEQKIPEIPVSPIVLPLPQPVVEQEIKPAPVLPVEELPQPKQEEPAPIAQAKVEEPVVIKSETSEIEASGDIFLKAADYLIGGIQNICQAIGARIKISNADCLAKTEALLYSYLGPKSPVWTLEMLTYFNEIKQVTTLPLEMSKFIPKMLQGIRGIKVVFSDGSLLYLDGQLNTIWSTPHIPYDFSTTLYNINTYITNSFQADEPVIFGMAPGYDIPTSEFFDFILSLDNPKIKGVSLLSLYGHRFEEIERINVPAEKKRHFLFGIWPWQFVQYRKVVSLKEFKPFYISVLKREIYLAEIELHLSQPNINKEVTLKGVALKLNLNEKIRLLILSNLPQEKTPLDALCNIYLGRWPNLEEGFQDYSRKVELFTYSVSSQRFFSTENLRLVKDPPENLESFFSAYLEALDSYVKWHFLPSGYENKDFSALKTQLYNLKAKMLREENTLRVIFQPPSQYSPLSDLEYACHRLNEKQIISPEGLRLWFSL